MSIYANVDHFRSIETPFYYYDLNVLDKTLKTISDEAGAFGFDVHYALKANSNNEILERIAKHGLGADCVSGNEILKALEIWSVNVIIATTTKTIINTDFKPYFL